MNSPLRQINLCEVCGNAQLVPVLDLGLHPLCDDLVPLGEARICRQYPIEVVFCATCVTAHQRYQLPKRDLFPDSYHYRARFTVDVLKGMSDLVDSCVRRFGELSGRKVLDIGCNDGSLLDIFRERGAITAGIEPTGAYRDAADKGHPTVNDFLSTQVARAFVARHGNPDFITFTNVFAHIEDLGEAIEALRILMSPRSVAVIENHYLGSVLDGNQFDTFYHEHPRTYSYRSFENVARSLGLPAPGVEFPSRYGGNIRVFLGNADGAGRSSEQLDELGAREDRFARDFATLSANVQRWVVAKRRYLGDQVRQFGVLRGKGFPARAAILLRLLGLDESSISAIHEKPGSKKIGHYAPGTRIPIVSDDVLFAQADQTKPLVNLAWHIPTEIRAYLSANGYTGEVIDILGAEDFARQS